MEKKKKKRKTKARESILMHGATGATLAAFGYKLGFAKKKKKKR